MKLHNMCVMINVLLHKYLDDIRARGHHLLNTWIDFAMHCLTVAHTLLIQNTAAESVLVGRSDDAFTTENFLSQI